VRALRRIVWTVALGGLVALALSGCGVGGSTQPSTPPNTSSIAFVGQQQTPPSTTVTSTPSPAKKKATPSHTIITITDAKANPMRVQVAVGARVIWQNSGKLPHTIQIAGGVRSPAVAPGKNASHVFKTVGTFLWSDPTQPLIKGTVVVLAK
jgi:plastocyanin